MAIRETRVSAPGELRHLKTTFLRHLSDMNNPHSWLPAPLMTLAVALALIVLSGCSSTSLAPANANPPKPDMQFVDLQGFDRDLGSALSAPLPRVDVAFYDRVSPNALPERLQRWMASVENGGGTVKVIPPKSSVTAKSPLLLISAISTLWSASSIAKDMAANAQFKAARAFDAEILLKTDDRGDSVVDKVVFVKRK